MPLFYVLSSPRLLSLPMCALQGNKVSLKFTWHMLWIMAASKVLSLNSKWKMADLNRAVSMQIYTGDKRGHQGKRADQIIEVLEDPWEVLKTLHSLQLASRRLVRTQASAFILRLSLSRVPFGLSFWCLLGKRIFLSLISILAPNTAPLSHMSKHPHTEEKGQVYKEPKSATLTQKSDDHELVSTCAWMDMHPDDCPW